MVSFTKIESRKTSIKFGTFFCVFFAKFFNIHIQLLEEIQLKISKNWNFPVPFLEINHGSRTDNFDFNISFLVDLFTRLNVYVHILMICK